jgi:hypothetical protein
MPTATQRNGTASRSGATAPSTKARSNGGRRSSARSGQTAATPRSTKASRGPSSRAAKGTSTSKRANAAAEGAPARTRGRTQAAKRPASSRGSKPSDGRERATETVSSAVGGVRETVSGAGKAVGVSLATGTLGAAAGIAGGVVLGRTIANRPRKVLGIKLPRRQADFSEVARSISDAGKQLGKLAGEVRAARQKAEQIGKVLA